jgi:hypothetical protein
MTENENHEDNDQYSKKAVDHTQWELHADIDLAHILSTEARAPLLSTSPLPYTGSDDDSCDDFHRFLSAPASPWVETAESRFEISTHSLDVNPRCHFQMAETAFLKPIPISGPSSFEDTFIPSNQGEKETNINKNHSTNVTSHSIDFQDFFKPSEECGMPDDSFSCTTNVTLDDLEIEPFNPDTGKCPIDNKNTSKKWTAFPPPPIKKRKVQHQVEDDDQVFALNLKALTKFKAKWGHCRVPPEIVSLHQWCEHIRKVYGLKCSGKLESKSLSYKAITDKQFLQLKEIGFEFFSGGKPPKSFKEKRLCSLKDFISKFGHCKVPKRYKEDKGLGPWCCEMRHSYKMIQDGKKPRSILTMAMYEDLQSLGFAWTV